MEKMGIGHISNEARDKLAPEGESLETSFRESLNPVLNSTRYVVENADHVQIDKAAIRAYAEGFEIRPHGNWMKESFDLTDLSEEERMMLCTVFNSISFSYWGEPYWSVEYKGTSYDRASWSMVAAILRSKEEGKSLLDPNVLSTLSKEDLGHMLRGNTEIPMLEERLKILNLVGKSIQKNGEGSFRNIIGQAEGDALKLVDLILKNFSPAFDDHYEYKGETVHFNKRAQALVESLSSMFDAEGIGSFSNTDQLTALADYIIPNLLREKGILRYSDELKHAIDTGQVIEKGSPYEVEIRAAAVWAIEWIRENVNKQKSLAVQTAAVNDDLWIKGGAVATPFHLVRTTAY
jgi:hypothetical protein